MDDISKKNEIVQAMTAVEYHLVLPEQTPNLSGYTKLPFGILASLGVGLASLPECFRTVATTAATSGEGLWRLSTIPGATGTLQMKNGVTLGNLVGENGSTITARARFTQAGGTSITTKTVMPLNPAILFMAATLMSIEQKLDNIQAAQEDMFDFLQEDKRAKLKGDQAFLVDILNNYKFNWDNVIYKQNMHIKVQDIKQETEQNLLFYRERIKKVINKRSFVIAEQEAKSQLSKVMSDMEDYQLSVYLYGFSSFLEVLLLGNFNSDYLNRITNKVEAYALQYRELYTESYTKLEGKLHASIKSHLIKGTAALSSAAGKVIAKVPVISKTQIDETLIEGGAHMKQFDSQRTLDMVQRLSGRRSSYVAPFVSCIKTINTLYNCPAEVLFDSDSVYIGVASATEAV